MRAELAARRTARADRIYLRNIAPFLDQVLASIPAGTRVYLVGGTLRNLFTAVEHPELLLRQRDYDLVVFGDMRGFVRNLARRGFIPGNIQRTHQIVMKKLLFEGATSLDDQLVLDIADAAQLGMDATGRIASFVSKKINFTVNGLALDLTKLAGPDWRASVTSPFMEIALRDIAKARLRLNPKKTEFFPTDTYACARFVAAGFAPPPKREILVLRRAFRAAPPENLERQVRKLESYAGVRRARRALRTLGLEEILAPAPAAIAASGGQV